MGRGKVELRVLLYEELLKRKNRNPAYSLRSFARDLGISKTALGDEVNGVRRLSISSIEVVGKALKFSDELVEDLKKDFRETYNNQTWTLIEGDELSFIEDWYYMGILSLAKLDEAKYCTSWIKDRLGISTSEAELALNVLSGQGFIENNDGRLVRKVKPLMTSVDIPSTSIREGHRQSLMKATEALDEVPVEFRDFTAVTYAIDSKKIKEVKEMVLKFHQKLGVMLEDGVPDQVYRLNIQFFPLTKLLQEGEAK